MKKTIIIGVGILAIFLLSGRAWFSNTFPSTGDVGIGTTIPSYPLDVQAGSIRQYANNDFILEPQTSAAGLIGLAFWNFSGVDIAGVKVSDATGEMRIGTWGNTYYPTFYSAGVKAAKIDNSQTFIIDSVLRLPRHAVNGDILSEDGSGNVIPISPYPTSGTPTLVLGTGAGTGATYTIAGNDFGGYITITTGTAPQLGQTIFSVTYNSIGAGHNGWPVMSAAAGGTVSSMLNFHLSQNSNPGFDLIDDVALTASKTYAFFYNTSPY